jgi:hypothetical protein
MTTYTDRQKAFILDLLRIAYAEGWGASRQGYNYERTGKKFDDSAWLDRRDARLMHLTERLESTSPSAGFSEPSTEAAADALTYDQAVQALTNAYGRGFRATAVTFADFAGPLSARLRPGIECAPWVIGEVKKLEQARASTTPPAAADTQGDLPIVYAIKQQDGPWYRCYTEGLLDWTKYPGEAILFVKESDAKQFAAGERVAVEIKPLVQVIAAAKPVSVNAQAAAADAQCATCNGHGMIGGPSYSAPDEGGVPCPDCAADTAADSGLTDLQRASIQAAADTAHRILCAGGDYGDELSDAGLRRELKESRDLLRSLLTPPTESTGEHK